MSRGQVEVSICENKEVLIRPAINWNTVPDFVKQLFDEFTMTPLEER